MATRSGTLVFASTAEGLTDAGLSGNIAFAFDGTDGNPAGMVKFTTAANGLSAEVEKARTGAGQTWETLFGANPGDVITAFELTALDRKYKASLSDNIDYFVRLVNSSDATIHSAGDLLSVTGVTGINDTSFHGTSGSGARAIDASYQASNTAIKWEIEAAISTGAGPTDVRLRLDNLAWTMTYTPAISVAEIEAALASAPWPRRFERMRIEGPSIVYVALMPPPGLPTPDILTTDSSYWRRRIVTHDTRHYTPWAQAASDIPTPPVYKLLFSQAPDLRGVGWRPEVPVAEAVDNDSGAGCYVGNSFVALYSVDGQVKQRRGGNPLDWTDATSTTVVGVTGQVWDVAVNDAGILCALIGSKWYLSYDLGASWTLGGTGGWSTPAVITSVRHLFIVHSPSGGTMTHWISVDGGKTFQ